MNLTVDNGCIGELCPYAANCVVGITVAPNKCMLSDEIQMLSNEIIEQAISELERQLNFDITAYYRILVEFERKLEWNF